MRVLFLTNIPSPYRVDFFNELGKSCELTVTFEGARATDRDEKWKSEDSEDDWSFTAIFLEGKRVRNDAFICFNVKKVLKEKWDKIILAGYTSPTAMLAIQYLRRHKIPFYLEVDGGMIKDESRVKHMIKRHFISSATEWISTGDKTTEYLAHYGAEKEKVHKFPFSSVRQRDIAERPATSEEKQQIRADMNISESKVVIFIGQFIYRKGIDVLLRAAGHISSGVGVYIIGGIPSAEYLKIISESKLENIHFIDFLTREEIRQYYRMADIFVLTTREDIWGLVINEAMSFGLPVVTTDKCIAGLELVNEGENGYIVPVGNAEKTAEKITELIDDDDKRMSFGVNSLRKIREYTIEEMARVHYEILKNA